MVTTYNIGRNQAVKVPWLTSSRFGLSIIGFIGTVCLYMMRVNMGVAIVCMTIDPNVTEEGTNVTISPGRPSDCPGRDDDAGTTEQTGDFEWSREIRGWVLSSFYLGYIVTQVPAGWLSKRFGGKHVLGSGMIALVLLTLVSPVAARGSVYLLIVVQVLKGMSSGTFYPAFFKMLGNWAPPNERSILAGIQMAGAPFGTVLSSIFSGILCASDIFGGWPSIFYLFGLGSFVWCIIWLLLVSESPSSHPRISKVEREFIESSIGMNRKQTGTAHVPWWPLLSSVPLLAVYIADMCYGWGWTVALTTLPQYLKDVLQFDIKQNGFYNSLPYICNFVITLLAAFIADAILTHELLSRTRTRKLLQTFAFVPSAGFAIGVSYLTCRDVTLAVALLSLWVGLMACFRSGSAVNPIDIAPAYVGILSSIDNVFINIPGVIGPPITSAMTKNGTPEEWRLALFVGAGIFMFGWIFYIIFGDAREAKWAKVADAESTMYSPVPGVHGELNVS